MFLADRINITTERQYTDEGFLIVPARISRVGIQEYRAFEMGLTDRKPDDIVRVYRPADEVFKPESLSSFSNKPITDDHPPELVNSKNSKKYSVGHAGPEVYQDGDFVKTTLYMTDETSIAKVESGKVQLSNGYLADIDWTPGITPDGEQYDAVQRNIKGNHIALVDRGRAGPACRVADNLPETGDEAIMPKITVDGVDFEVSEQAAQAVGKLQARLSDMKKDLEEKDEELEKKEDEAEEMEKKSKETADSLRAQLDDAKAKIPTAATLDSMVAERIKLIDTVRAIAPDIKWEGKDADTLRKEVVAAKCQGLQLDSESPEYIRARFDILADQAISNPQYSLDEALRKQVTDSKDKVVDTRPADVIAREKMMADSRDAWKRKGA